MATVVLVYGGRWIFQKALQGFRSVAFGMETLIGAGALCAYGYSVVHFFSGSIHLYFDTASMLITLTLLGKMLERRAKNRVQASLEGFLDILPTKVRLCTDQIPNGRYVSSKLLNKKDIFRVVTGETVPADGLITTGEGVIDESTLTGEAEPVRKRAGERLKSGTEVVRGDLFVRAEAVGKASTLGQMIEIMEKALSEKTEWEGKTDRILQFFVPAILILALGTGVVCFFVQGSIEAGMIRAVTVMVISCPCALGVAIPLARVAGISVAGNKGILVRDFSAFEQTERIDTFVFDKTGTVTTGQWSLLKIHALPGHRETDILSMAAELERSSDHYIAAEILREARSRGVPVLSDASLDHIAHMENGVSGTFNHRRIKIGSKSFVQSGWDPGDLPDLKREESAVYMTMDGKPCAVFVFGDRIREGVPEMIRTLHANGYGTVLISGDGEETTRAIGETIGVQESEGGKLPRDKAARVAALQQAGHSVAMIGDGINDAPALVQSDLAFAVHSGSHLGREASHITLRGGNPVQILDYLALAKGINRKVFQNLMGALIYNVVGIPVAMAGLLSPLVAVIAMFMSSLTVTGNTLLLIKKYSKSEYS